MGKVRRRAGRMRDGLGRTVDYLRLSITEGCNLRCAYCRPAVGEDAGAVRAEETSALEQPLTAGELERIVAAFAALGVRKVRLTGGEPLTRPDVVEIVARLKAVPGVRELTMTTNATLLAPLAADLRAAGLDRVNVSLDTLDAERYCRLTRGGQLADVLAGLEALDAAGFSHTKINCVLIGGVNDDEIAQLAYLARDRAFDMRFIELMPIGPAASWPRSRFVSASLVLERVSELEPAGVDGVSCLYTAPGWAGRVGLIRPMSCPFCATCSRVRVTADGRLLACLRSTSEVSLHGLEGKELACAIQDALLVKPAHHEMSPEHASGGTRDMARIGG